jgi:hypothetical protein
VSWTPPPWTTIGTAGSDQRTPDLSPVIQQIVDQGDWSSGNALVLVVSGTGERVAESYDGDAGGAPLLHIEYGAGMPSVSAPTFNPAPGTYIGAIDVELDTATLGATIYYTLNGSDPNPGGASTFLYSPGSPISLSTTTTVKALATRTGYTDSAVSHGVFTIVQGGNSAPVLNPIGNKSVDQGATLSFTVTASDDSGPPALSADLSALPAVNNADFDPDTGDFSWMPLVTDVGRTYTVVFTATDLVDPLLTDSEPVDISVRDPGSGVAVDYRVMATRDDAEERVSGYVSNLSGSDLEMVHESTDQIVGMRFRGVAVPRGATITNAHVQFQVDEATSEPTVLQIHAQLAGNAPEFASSAYNIS